MKTSSEYNLPMWKPSCTLEPLKLTDEEIKIGPHQRRGQKFQLRFSALLKLNKFSPQISCDYINLNKQRVWRPTPKFAAWFFFFFQIHLLTVRTCVWWEGEGDFYKKVQCIDPMSVTMSTDFTDQHETTNIWFTFIKLCIISNCRKYFVQDPNSCSSINASTEIDI